MTARYLGMNRSDGLTVTDLEHISQSIGDILRTPVGSRVMRRDYGSLLASMIDQPQTPALELQIKVAMLHGGAEMGTPRHPVIRHYGAQF